MSSYSKLIESSNKNNSILCIGLDSETKKIPEFLGSGLDALLRFNYSIIDATHDLVSSYKINFAFYEQYGIEGIEVMRKTFGYIPADIIKIADCKRGDIGNTSAAYASACYEYFGADAVTIHPYMGLDSVQPFLEFHDKFVFILARTSNNSADDFQNLICEGEPLYKHVVRKSLEWGGKEKIGFVVGATRPDELEQVRNIAPERVFLIPGIGAQGGDLKATLKANSSGPAIINVSRGIIYASDKNDYIDTIRKKALNYREEINAIIREF